MVGHGKNIWPNLHITEGRLTNSSSMNNLIHLFLEKVADLFTSLFDLVIHNIQTKTLFSRMLLSEGFYFCENGKHEL